MPSLSHHTFNPQPPPPLQPAALSLFCDIKSLLQFVSKRENLDTDKHTVRMPCEDKGRYQGDIAESKKCQDCQKIIRSLDRNTEHISPS